MFFRILMWNISTRRRWRWNGSIWLRLSVSPFICRVPEPDLSDWEAMVQALRTPDKKVTIALVGKYIQLHDAYLSVVEALKHGGIAVHASVSIRWVDSENVTEENVGELLGRGGTASLFPEASETAGIEGKITAIRYAREHDLPYLGLCLGMQLAIVEYARNVAGYPTPTALSWIRRQSIR